MIIEQLNPNSVTRPILKLLNQLGDTNKLKLAEARDIIKEQISNNHFTYIIFQDDLPLGVGSIIISKKLIRNGRKCVFFEDIAIHKKYHRRGLGKKLVQHLIKIARAVGAYKIMLTCDDKNIEFYRKLGFEICGNNMRIDL